MSRINESVTKEDMSLETLNQRLNYRGGNQEERLIKDKLNSLKKALLYSYQAATIILSNKKEFRCLINADNNKPAYDNKIISIPFEDVCLNDFPSEKGRTSEAIVPIEIKMGDVITWKENNTHWLIYLQYLEEEAYFRGEIRRCDQQVTINGEDYWVYIRGPVETSIKWMQKSNTEYNKLNYSLVMYITADENTKQYFQRFKTLKVLDPRDDKEKTWQVAGVDPYYGDGILQLFLDEYFENSIADAVAAAVEKPNSETSLEEDEESSAAYINGLTTVQQYSKAYYTIVNATGGQWYLKWKGKEQNLKNSSKTIPLNISIGELGTFTLIYRIAGQEDITLDVEIVAL